MEVGILLFNQVEVLDFAGPYEVFAGAREDDKELFSVSTVGRSNSVICRGGLKVKPDVFFTDQPAFDILVVPGGPGTRAPGDELKDVVEFIRQAAKKTEITAGVCTGSFLMAKAGLLNGLRATTHYRYRMSLKEQFPEIQVVEDRIVDCGRVVTSAGVATGIDMALYLLKRLHGEALSRQVRENMEYHTHR